ncbi:MULTISPECIES: hypothetical protein [unclassified Gilliamella]|uniref:hypothetical protein n=1 Tax=unclassified Gilliamella TaxID=2685620 RepID=UPI00080E39B8|nr:hypothetical protein [Gilliamella apicola]OCG20271.1 hypothetical protein A9G23_05390 [Gilliamella apicola]OCG22645.1 hypothetical protein A9G22_06445 [Gilliamella apicola]
MCKLDFHFYKSSLSIIILGIILYIIGNFFIPLYNGLTVTLIEHVQSLFLLFMCCYTYYYAKRVAKHSELYKFWIWTIFWWFMLFGRGISWGRDFFPEVPRFYYKIIAGIIMALPIFSIFLPTIRREIVRRYKFEKIPVWHIFLAFLFLGIADIAEHRRIGHELLVITRDRKDLIEELMEIPCLLCLALTTFYMQKNEQERVNS